MEILRYLPELFGLTPRSQFCASKQTVLGLGLTLMKYLSVAIPNFFGESPSTRVPLKILGDKFLQCIAVILEVEQC